eukprot:gene4711-3403_t
MCRDIVSNSDYRRFFWGLANDSGVALYGEACGGVLLAPTTEKKLQIDYFLSNLLQTASSLP